jgi:uncharacterized Zn-finger protein
MEIFDLLAHPQIYLEMKKVKKRGEGHCYDIA